MSISSFADKQFLIHIDSHQRISGTHQDGTYKIKVTNGTIQDYDRVVILSATIPKSYYAIEEGFNTFTLTETKLNPDPPFDILSTDLIIEIPAGTYSANQFKDTLPTLMIAESLANGYAYTYALDLSTITAKFTYTMSGNSGYQSVITTTSNVHEQLGFEGDSDNAFVGDALVSTTVIDMSPENNLFIRSSICSGGDNNSDILQDIQGSGVPPYGQINYQSTNLEGYSKGLNRSSDVFRFYISNEDDEGAGQRILQLNQKNWTATLLLYKRTTLPQLMKDSIKLNAIQNE